MAADGPVSSGDNAALSRRLAELNSKLDEVSAATSRTKNITRIVTVLIALSALAGVYMLFTPFLNAYQNRESYKTEFLAQAQERLIPAIEAEAKLLVEKSIPKLLDVAKDQYNAREGEIYTAVQKQLDLFVENMKGFGSKEFETRRNRIESAITLKLKEAVPELGNEDTAELVLVNTQKAMEAAVERILTDKFGGHIESVNNLANNLAVYPIPEDVQAMTDDQLREELSTSLLQYASVAFKDRISPETKGVLKAISEESN